MSEIAEVAIGLFAALAPFGALHAAALDVANGGAAGRWRVGVPIGVAAALIIIGVALTDPILDWLDVSAESFQVAAGIVLLSLALRLLVWGESVSPMERAGAAPLWRAASLVPGPVLLVAALSYGARIDAGSFLAGSVLAAALAALLLASAPQWLRSAGPGGLAMLGRASGALAVVIGVQLIVNGVQSV